MGRFQREAITVDENDPSGSVYQTEDDYTGLFYKFIPSQKQNLAGRGKLYALKIPGIENTSNKDGLISTGDTFPVEWVSIKDPLAESTKTKIQGKDAGASIFKGGEGIIHTNDKDLTTNIFFTCKKGGKAGLGQIWKYSPSKEKITLFYESDNANNLWDGDNINITPWGDLIICEDNGSNACKLVGCTPNGTLYPLGRVAGNSSSEVAGICFSPDGKNMYLNIQDEGKTIVVRGDWSKIREYRDGFDSNLIHYDI
jgi:secreted PhoX family phosphatase